MFEVEIVNTSDPVFRVLRSNPHQLFDHPFVGYAVCLFGAADEGVANWLARELVALDSLTGEQIACVVFAKRTQLYATVTKHRAPLWFGYGNDIRDATGGYKLDIVQQFSYRPMVRNAEPDWHPSDQEIRVVTYEVDRIATDLGVLDKLPCIVFFDVVLSAQPSLDDVKRHPLAVLPLKDAPGSEVIRFFRRVLQRFRESYDLGKYQQRLLSLVECERRIRMLSERDIEPLKREIERASTGHVEQISRVVAFKDNLPGLVAGASIKGLRKALARTPELAADSALALETRIAAEKTALVGLLRTINAVEFYAKLKEWPLSGEAQVRLSHIAETFLKRWVPELDSGRIIVSRGACLECLSELRAQQADIIRSALSEGPKVDALIEQVTQEYAVSRFSMLSKLQALENDRGRLSEELDRLRDNCGSAERPSIVDVVVHELKQPQPDVVTWHQEPLAQPISVYVLNTPSIGDTYYIRQAAAVGPGAVANNATLVSDS